MSHGLPPRISLEIGELSLRGFPPDQRDRIVAQFKARLADLLSDPAVAARLGQSRFLPTLRMGLAPASPPAVGTSPGEQAASTIIKGLQP